MRLGRPHRFRELGPGVRRGASAASSPRAGGLLTAGLLGLCALAGGCQGDGEGQMTGSLFLRGCPTQDPTTDEHPELPTPLPAFDLAPRYFFGEITRARMAGFSGYDTREVERLTIRLQRSSNQPDRTDSLQLLVYDLENFAKVQDEALAQGLGGVPILPPDVAGTTAPLPSDPGRTVRASLALNTSCLFPLVAPQLRGTIRFTELGRKVGETVAGELTATIEDPRGLRETGAPRDTAGTLSGWFRFELRTGAGAYRN